MQTKRPVEFPLADGLIYLNHAAVGVWPQRTHDAVVSFATENLHHGARYYPQWLKKETELRQQLQCLLNAPSADDIALVKNTSEALSVVAFGLDWQRGDNIVSSNEEFPSNRVPWQALNSLGVDFREADLYGANTPEEALFNLVDGNTKLLTISSIQYATGLRMDLVRLGEFCRQRGILFCIDAIQSLGAVQFDVQKYHADFVMADGHKWLLGPEGLGMFYSTPQARDKLKLNQYGWRMLKDFHDYQSKPWEIHPTSRRFECGSPNMLGIHALSASLSLLLEAGMNNIEAKVTVNAELIADEINSHPNLQLLSQKRLGLPSGIVCFSQKNVTNEQLYCHLIEQGVICAQRGGGIRFSPHFYHNEEDLIQAVRLAGEI